MPTRPAVARMARKFVTDACRCWDVDDLAQDAVLLASELVEFSIECDCSRLNLWLELCPDGGRGRGGRSANRNQVRRQRHVDPWDVIEGVAAASGSCDDPVRGRTLWAASRNKP